MVPGLCNDCSRKLEKQKRLEVEKYYDDAYSTSSSVTSEASTYSHESSAPLLESVNARSSSSASESASGHPIEESNQEAGVPPSQTLYMPVDEPQYEIPDSKGLVEDENGPTFGHSLEPPTTVLDYVPQDLDTHALEFGNVIDEARYDQGNQFINAQIPETASGISTDMQEKVDLQQTEEQPSVVMSRRGSLARAGTIPSFDTTPDLVKESPVNEDAARQVLFTHLIGSSTVIDTDGCFHSREASRRTLLSTTYDIDPDESLVGIYPDRSFTVEPTISRSQTRQNSSRPERVTVTSISTSSSDHPADPSSSLSDVAASKVNELEPKQELYEAEVAISENEDFRESRSSLSSRMTT